MNTIYVPNLILKPAEIMAFRGLPRDVEDMLQPCFIVPKIVNTSVGWFTYQQISLLRRSLLDTNVVRVAKPFYLDVSSFEDVAAEQEHPGVYFIQQVLRYGFIPIPTISVSCSDLLLSDLRAKVANKTNGICIRIHLKEIEGLEERRLLDVSSGFEDLGQRCGY